MKTKQEWVPNKKTLDRIVSASSRLEGLSLEQARKDTKVINLLKRYGRGFSL
jgi:hypothetical protein